MNKPLTAKQYQDQHGTRRGAGLASNVKFRRKSSSGVMSAAEFVACGLGLEENLQIACVDWFKLNYPKLMIRGSMNGADLKGGGKAWNQFLRTGVLDGEADLHIIVPSGEYHSLFVEMKRRNGKQRASQIRFEQDAINKGHGYAVARSLDQFRRVVSSYLENGTY